ncbi:hypothetical protein ACIPV2_10350 [Microbacterium sp. NPDC089987]|uniref:hypothetical protein n=1 Tax=Microbacterium sp. NPDC089987 TaxID=3364202 RepID=UPI003818C9DB
MIEVSANDDGARARRDTWMTGGVLFVLSALATVVPPELTFGLPFDIASLLFGLGAVIFAIGLGSAGSVTARRPLGTGAIVALVAWTVAVAPVLWMLVTRDGPIERGADAYYSTVTVASIATELISVALALIATAQIGRAGVVPKPWRWAPLWALVAVVVAQLVPNLVASSGAVTDQTQLIALFSLIGLMTASAVAFLGVAAIVLALRPVRGSTAVYGSAT